MLKKIILFYVIVFNVTFFSSSAQAVMMEGGGLGCKETCSKDDHCDCKKICKLSNNEGTSGKCSLLDIAYIDHNYLDQFQSLSPEGQTLLLLQIEDFKNKCDEIERLSNDDVLEKINSFETSK